MWQQVSSLYLSGPLPYVRRHITVNKICRVHPSFLLDPIGAVSTRTIQAKYHWCHLCISFDTFKSITISLNRVNLNMCELIIQHVMAVLFIKFLSSLCCKQRKSVSYESKGDYLFLVC